MIIKPDITLTDMRVNSKKQVLEGVARAISHHFGQAVDSMELFDKLLERERIGSTAIGGGVAIPHIRLDIDQPLSVLVRLKVPVAFDAPDHRPVDLVYVLVAPEKTAGASLIRLARISSFFRDEEFCDLLRAEQGDLCALIGFRNDQIARAA